MAFTTPRSREPATPVTQASSPWIIQGDASSSAVPVLVTATVTGTVAVTQSTSPWVVTGSGTAGAAATGVVTVQGIASMTPLLVSPIHAQAGVQGASGVVTALTQRVVLATDVALPAGTAIIGALVANQSVNVAQINGVTPLMGSGATGTGSHRVTLSTDQVALTTAGVFSVKIDQTTPGTTNKVSLSDETTKVIGTVNQGTSPWVVSVSAIVPGTGATNLGKIEDEPHVSGDVGVFMLGIRNDAPSTLAGATADYSGIAVDSAGRVWIGGSAIDGGAYTAGSNKLVTLGAVFDDTSPTAAGEDVVRVLRMSANRNLYSTIRDAAGNERGANVDANNNLGVVLAAETTKVIGTVRVASGGVASGSFASGSIASGAVASGAIASGAVAAGAVAAGAFVSGSVLLGALADGAIVTLGAKTDAKSTATDATSITLMQVAKQISASVQSSDTALATIQSDTNNLAAVQQQDTSVGSDFFAVGGYDAAQQPYSLKMNDAGTNARVTLFQAIGTASFTATAQTNNMNVSGTGTKDHSLQVANSGGVITWDVRLEGSNDQTTWTQILAHTNATGTGVTVWPASGVRNPVLYTRLRCAGHTGAGTLTVTAYGSE